jgi:hypothetical protein
MRKGIQFSYNLLEKYLFIAENFGEGL